MIGNDRRFLRRFEVLATRYALTLNLCEDIIKRHGVARNIREGANGTHSFHDYQFLCFTKATKTLGSIYITSTAFRGEDSLILVRSVYEAYVQMAFLFKNPEAINDLVANRVRATAGEVIADRKKRRYLDIATQKEVGEMHSIGKMARGTSWMTDSKIHEFLYSYLCSYSHMDIQCLPYFIEGDRFTTLNKDRIHQAGFYSTFYAVLLLDLMGLLKLHSITYRRKTARSLRETKRVLVSILGEMSRLNENGDVPSHFMKRLATVGHPWLPE